MGILRYTDTLDCKTSAALCSHACMSTHPSSFLGAVTKSSLSDSPRCDEQLLDALERYFDDRSDDASLRDEASLAFERSYSLKWLTTLLGSSYHDEGIIDRAAELLSSLSKPPGDLGGCSTVHSFPAHDGQEVRIHIKDTHMGSDVHATGFRTWDSADYLARKVLAEPSSILPQAKEGAPLRMLELGSGTGLAGIALLKACQAYYPQDRGVQAHLTLTDYDDETLASLKDNVTTNLPGHDEDTASVTYTVTKLAWEEPSSLVGKGPFDLIVGSDVVYEPHHSALLYSVAEALLSKSPGSAMHLVLSLRPTHTRDIEDFERRFSGHHQEAGMAGSVDEAKVSLVESWDSKSYQYPLRHYKIGWRL